MNVKSAEQKAEKQIQFWAILGPFILLATLVVLYIKVSDESFYIPVAALIGLPICWKWKMKGLTFSLLFLGILSLLNFSSIPSEDVLWQLGLSVAVALSFVVTALSAEEALSVITEVRNLSTNFEPSETGTGVQNEVQHELLASENERLKGLVKEREMQCADLASQREKLKLSIEDQKSLHSILTADYEGLKTTYEERTRDFDERILSFNAQVKEYEGQVKEYEGQIENYHQQATEYGVRIDEYEQVKIKLEERIKEFTFALAEKENLNFVTKEEQIELKRIQNEIVRFEALLEISQTELQSVNVQYEAAATELLQKQNQVALFEERMEEISFENAQLYEQMTLQGKETILANQKLNVQEKLIEEVNFQLSAVKQQADEARNALQDYETVKQKVHILESDLETFVSKLQASETALQQVLQENEKIARELKELHEPADLADENDVKRLKGFCKHYREQVKERSDLLAEARKQLFHTEEKLAAIQADFVEYKQFEVSDSEKAIELQAAQLERESAVYKASLQAEMKELQDLIGDLFKNKIVR